VAADITQRGSTEQRVGDGMQQRVGIGVTEQSVGVRDGHAAEYERSAHRQRMYVPTFADADGVHRAGSDFSRRSASAKSDA
jgi:hypothetical protein